MASTSTSTTSGGSGEDDMPRITSTGEVFGCGWGDNCQLATYGSVSKMSTLSMSGKRICFAAAGLNHTACISNTGELYTCGKPDYGRLGTGSRSDSRLLQVTMSKRVTFVSCGGFHTAAITSGRQLFTFGRGDKGQLGHGELANTFTPEQVLSLKGKKVSSVACGSEHTLVTCETGELLACGSNDHFQLGTGSIELTVVPTFIEVNTTNMHRDEVVNPVIHTISAGGQHSAALMGGQLFCWGTNTKGQCGVGTFSPHVEVPTATVLPGSRVCVSVNCGLEHTAALTMKGEVFTWGSEEYSQGGHGPLSMIDVQAQHLATLTSATPSSNSIGSHTPRQVKEALFKQTVVSLACGAYHTVALTEQGSVYTWGLGDKGQLGNNSTSSCSSPYHVRGQIQSKIITAITAGGRHTLAITTPTPVLHIEASSYESDFRKLLGSAELSDVTVLTAGDPIPAHKVVLARCLAFRTALLDGADTLANVTDVPEKVVRLILEFLYCGAVSLPSGEGIELEVQLFSVAERLSLAQLCAALKEHTPRCDADQQDIYGGGEHNSHKLPLPVSFLRMHEIQMRQWVNNPSLSDITFALQDDEGNPIEFKAHKAVLSCRSSVFKTLITSGFKESRTAVIELPTVTPPVFRLFLNYIYTDQLQLDMSESDHWVELLMVANQYEVERLKNMCEDFIEKGIDVENVAWLFDIADKNGAHQLRAWCDYFLLTKFSEVSQTEGFNNLPEESKERILKRHRVAPHQAQAAGEKGGCLIS
ncbi:RCC1 domain [Pelomyxa schiedti]|nr:RCC1 domain [Pelomyxa schiedti]